MIGVFDSGSGGLTVLAPLRAQFPNADIIYFGDIKNAPYGNRTHEELTRLTVDAIRFLRKEGASRIVSACNSLSASLSLSLFDMLDLAPNRLIEMVGPTAASLKETDGRLLLCATAATINSRIYQTAFSMLGKEIRTLPLPELAGAVEQGQDAAAIETIIRDGFSTVEPNSFDTVILSCTHYPLVGDIFKKVLPGVKLVDPGEAVALRAKRDWPEEDEGEGKTRFVVSQESAPFRELVGKLFPEGSYTIEVLKA